MEGPLQFESKTLQPGATSPAIHQLIYGSHRADDLPGVPYLSYQPLHPRVLGERTMAKITVNLPDDVVEAIEKYRQRTTSPRLRLCVGLFP